MATTAALLTLTLITAFFSATSGAPPPHFPHPPRLPKTHPSSPPSSPHSASKTSPPPPSPPTSPAEPHHHLRPHRLLPPHVPHVLPPSPPPRALPPRPLPLHFLRTLAFGTKIASLAANRCLTVTASAGPTATRKVFINGVEITKPDLFNNGFHIVHTLQGFVAHLSPLSCAIEAMTTLSFTQKPPPPVAAFFIMRLMLKDAMTRLRISGYSTVALAMRVRYAELSGLKSMTLFAIDDESIFLDGGGGGGGHAYVADLGFHVVPNRLLMAADLIGLPKGTALPTMERGRKLVVTSAGDGGPLAPTRINYVKVKRFDLVHNKRIVVHGLSMPFRHVDQ
ncbi:hypothetical protein DH2020_024877 [Rehmannia glutinosa]|uniref:Uncharacterized protein n=1 Tax=Rehmannia glutinosa TaxID=99300 RepID=A0ABR0W3Z0_REHGL